MNHQKIDETDKVLKYIAKINGAEPIEYSVLKQIADKENGGTNTGVKGENKMPAKRFSYLGFFKSKELRLTSICLMAIWFSWSVVYFGISYNIKNVPGKFPSMFISIEFMKLSRPVVLHISFLFAQTSQVLIISVLIGDRYWNVVYLGLSDAVRTSLKPCYKNW